LRRVHLAEKAKQGNREWRHPENLNRTWTQIYADKFGFVVIRADPPAAAFFEGIHSSLGTGDPERSGYLLA
jgi:hypothetical protein